MFVPPIGIYDVLELEVRLVGIEPVIHRRLHVGAPLELDVLHQAIQIAFGWQDRHLHAFRIGGFHFTSGRDDGAGDKLTIVEAGAPLGAVARIGESFEYRYDFGDDWRHEVAVTGRVENPTSVLTCVDGARACPPEDCGGAPGYEELLQALADARHPRHAELKRWVGRKFDPERLDLVAVNRKLAALLKRI